MAINIFRKIKDIKRTEELFIKFFSKIESFFNYPKYGFMRNQVNKFMELNFSYKKTKGLKVLDVGAGDKPYKKYFNNANYESCDSKEALEEINLSKNQEHTFYCDITKNIPRNDETYDIVVCNQVFEHINEPQKAANEIYRVLKKNGEFYMSVPQCQGVHMEPHNYFNFLNYGIKYILLKSNFKDIQIKALGGIYNLLGKVLINSVNYTFSKFNYKIRIFLLIIEIPVRVIVFFISLFLYNLDKFDTKKKWTLSYGVKAIK